MAKLTVAFGVLLGLVALAGHHLQGLNLHPLFLGIALVVCGALAMTESTRQRMIWMHVAVTLALIGFLVPGTMSTILLVKAHSQAVPLARPGMIHEQMLVALLCLVFVVLCLRSFVAARRGRTAGE